MAAQNPLFSIPELVELILSPLSFHDLLRAAQVCSTWRSLACKHSHRLERSLFLTRPSASATKHLVLKNETPLSDPYSPWASPVPCVIGGSFLAEWQGIKLATIAKINPFLQNDISYAGAGSGGRNIRFRPSRWKLSKLLRLRQDTNETSIIRQMYITLPPCTDMTIENTNAMCLHPACGAYSAKRQPVEVNDEHGLRIGALVDVLNQVVDCAESDGTLMCEHERLWFGVKTENAALGMGLKIFEASSTRQAIVLKDFVHEAHDDVVRARMFAKDPDAGANI